MTSDCGSSDHDYSDRGPSDRGSFGHDSFDLDWPRIVLVAPVVATAAVGVTAATTSDAAFGAYNYERDVGSGIALVAYAAGRFRPDRDDPESVAETVYAAVRRRLVDQFEADHTVTHAELYAHCRDSGLPDDRLNALHRVTPAYERARFSSQRLSTETAETALRAGSLLAKEIGTGTGTEAGTGTDGTATTEGTDR